MHNRPAASTITDGNGGAITVGDTLTVSVAGVRDADNIGAGNPLGTLANRSVSYYWQFEADPGSGVFQDIILLPAGDWRSRAPDGTFKVSPDLAGLSLRVKAIYQDGHGTTESCSPQPTTVVEPGAPVVPTAPTPVVDATGGGGPAHALRPQSSSRRSRSPKPTRPGRTSSDPNIRAPLGLRAVDGSNNNLMNLNGNNHTEYGAADNVFPR
jgi:hypothetical protein